jgi:hypothetical protein
MCGIGWGINCDCFEILFCGDMDFVGVLFSVVIYVLLFITLWCSVGIGSSVVVVGHVILHVQFNCKLEISFKRMVNTFFVIVVSLFLCTLYYVLGSLVLSLLLLFISGSVVILDFTVSWNGDFVILMLM